jgi:hypothetical protein
VNNNSKGNALKRAVLIVLLAVATIVWGRNFINFGKSGDSYMMNSSPVDRTLPDITKVKDIPYHSPRIDPFFLPAKTDKVPKRTPKADSSKIADIRKTSSKYIMKGFISESNSPQALLRESDQHASAVCRVVSIGDSLDGWIVQRIGDGIIIFAKGKFRDTLEIQSVGREF